MSDPLYKRDLLRLAAGATGSGRLSVPCQTGAAHNPACGDKVTMDLAIAEGRIEAVAHHTMACVLTQASAAILGAEATGMSHAEVVELHGAVRTMLEGGEPPAPPFDIYSVFDGAAAHTSRHKCVLLPIEAALAAFETLEGGEAGSERT